VLLRRYLHVFTWLRVLAAVRKYMPEKWRADQIIITRASYRLPEELKMSDDTLGRHNRKPVFIGADIQRTFEYSISGFSRDYAAE